MTNTKNTIIQGLEAEVASLKRQLANNTRQTFDRAIGVCEWYALRCKEYEHWYAHEKLLECANAIRELASTAQHDDSLRKED